jgi:hypothetical protein
MTTGTKRPKDRRDETDQQDQCANALALFRVWCEAAETWRRQKSDVTEARCRAARQDDYLATAQPAPSLSSAVPIAEEAE